MKSVDLYLTVCSFNFSSWKLTKCLRVLLLRVLCIMYYVLYYAFSKYILFSWKSNASKSKSMFFWFNNTCGLRLMHSVLCSATVLIWVFYKDIFFISLATVQSLHRVLQKTNTVLTVCAVPLDSCSWLSGARCDLLHFCAFRNVSWL